MGRFRRRFRFLINHLKEKFKSIELLWDQWRCIHDFRPAAINEKPGEICRFCDKINLLTPGEYYAKFGETNWRQWK